WLLSGVAEFGRDGTPLGKDASSNPFGVQFTYAPFASGFSLSSYVALTAPVDTPTATTCGAAGVAGSCSDGAQGMNGSCQPQDVAAFIDMDGDGLPDMVWGETSTLSANGGGIRWAKNTSKPGSPSFGPVQTL